ncbi:MAG: hypothetical protein LBJ00_09910 [Planctomycetaceae bacterium]|nr:hypothetical protein [Planctomycetaceae bacterium]
MRMTNLMSSFCEAEVHATVAVVANVKIAKLGNGGGGGGIYLNKKIVLINSIFGFLPTHPVVFVFEFF